MVEILISISVREKTFVNIVFVVVVSSEQGYGNMEDYGEEASRESYDDIDSIPTYQCNYKSSHLEERILGSNEDPIKTR